MDVIHNQALISNPVLIFFIVLVIILLAPLLLKRFKIPHIVGLIIAGVVVGPYGFNLLANDSSFEIFGQVGLLYLMFLAGLEIDMYHFKRNLKKGFVFGLYTLFIPIVLGMVCSVYILNVSWPTSILLASMYASHTLIAYPIVSRYELTKSPVVLISIVGTIFAVFGALIALAIGVGIHRDGGFDWTFLLRLLGLVSGYIAVILYTFPRVTRWFFKTFNDKVTQFVFVLAMVFLASWLAQVIGLEAVVGAFFAGLVLNRYIPSLSPIMSRIEFVGNAIFIPYFLIGVGMLINVRVITDINTIWVTINMIGVAVAAKWIAAWITQITYKMSAIERNIMFGLSTAHTAVALAVVMIGYKIILPDGSHLLNESILNGTILMILVTCTLSSIVTERAAAKEKIFQTLEGGMEDKKNSKVSDKILISVSNPITTQGLIDLAIMLRGGGSREPLNALHVRTDDSKSAIMVAQNTLHIAERASAAVDAKINAIERYDMNIVTGIINTVKEREISELILGLHQRNNVVDSFFGNKVEQLLKQTNKMLIISRCFIPINTITRIIICAPAKAEFETGFCEWVIRIVNLAKQIGCRAIFCADKNTTPYIKGVIHETGIGIRSEFRELDAWSDYILLANKTLDDDMLIMIGARRTSISFDSEMDNMPGILSKYFNHNNLLVIYPEQFGREPQLTTFVDPLASDVNITPSDLLLKVRGWYKYLIIQKKKITHRNRRNSNLDL